MKWGLGLVLAPIFLVVLLGILLYLPFVQRWAIGFIEEQATAALGMPVRVGALRIVYPLDVSLREVLVERAPQDTFLCLDRLDVSVTPLPLLSNTAVLPHIYAEGLLYRTVDSLGRQPIVARLSRVDGRFVAVDWQRERASALYLAAEGLSVKYQDIATESSEASQPLKWQVDVHQLDLLHSQLDVTLPEDSLSLKTTVPRLSLSQASVDLGQMLFELQSGVLKSSSLIYRQGMSTALVPGIFDPRHIELSDLTLELGALRSQGSALSLQIRRASLRERSGFELKQLQGHYVMDSVRMGLDRLALRTEYSEIYGSLDVPWRVFKGDTTAHLQASLDASIATPDVFILAGRQLPQLRGFETVKARLIPILQNPISIVFDLRGTLAHLQISEASIFWQDVMDLNAEGGLYHLLDKRKRRGQLSFAGGVQDGSNTLLAACSPELAKSYRLPAGLTLEGKINIMRGHLLLASMIKHLDAVAQVNLTYTAETKRYGGQLNWHGVDLRNYVLQSPIGRVHAELELRGRGFDPLDKYTQSYLKGHITQLEYGLMNLKDITFGGKLERGEMNVYLNSFNEGLNCSLLLDGLLSKQSVESSVLLDSEGIDFQALGFSQLPMGSRFRLRGEMRSDLKERHQFAAHLEDVLVTLDGDSIQPKEVEVRAQTTEEACRLHLSSGDLQLKTEVGEAPSKLSQRVNELSAAGKTLWVEVQHIEPMSTKLEELVAKLPRMSMDIEMGKQNALRSYLAQYRVALERLEGQLRLRPTHGVEGHLSIRDIRQDTLRLNCIDLTIDTERYPRGQEGGWGSKSLDSMRLVAELRLDKTRFRQQRGFSLVGRAHASLQDALVSLTHTNEHGLVQNRFVLRTDWSGPSYQMHIPEEHLVLSGRTLLVNPDNELSLSKRDYFARADIRIQADHNRVSLSLQAQHDGSKEQTASLSIRNIYLEDYQELGLQDLSGLLSGDISYQRLGTLAVQPTLNGDVSIQDLSYEGKQLGHFAAAVFYEPRNNNSHYVTADVSYQGNQALTVNGIYTPGDGRNALRGSLEMLSFPLEIVNPFSAQYAIYLGGIVNGKLDLGGSLRQPRLTGDLLPSKGAIELRDYATTLQLDSLPLQFDGEQIRLDRYALRSAVDPEHPIYATGTIGILGESMMQTNLRVQTEETMVMNQSRPKTDHQIVYGRLVTSANLRLSGPLNALRMRGKIGILGGTNLTYVMHESPLDASDKSTGLVEFKDFSDTIFLQRSATEAELGGLDASVSISIDPSVFFHVNLTADGRDYMRMQGGGSMQLRYLPYGEISLRGRYDMTGGGALQYTLPVVGSKLFTIDPNGYLTFDGDVRNPYINFTATQKVRAATGESGGKTNFNVSIKAKDRVDNINLSFDLAAPENLSIQNSLAGMSAEERGKQAIGLLATGTYLGSGSGGSNLNLNETFSALLQNQINTVAGNLLSGTDLSLGMEMNDGRGGSEQTSYTYSFSRRFYNDRIRVVVGGKIQTGQTTGTRDQTFIDNVSLEYQLDKAGERFIQLYHKRITDNVIEGEYSETGAGVLLRRKLYNLSDLFQFGKKKVPAQDTIRPIVRKSLTLPQESE